MPEPMIHWSDILELDEDVAAPGAPWSADDLAAILRHQLVAHLAPAGPTFADALHAPEPPPEPLDAVDRFCATDAAALPAPIVTTIRLLSRAARERAGLATLDATGASASTVEALLTEPWLDDRSRELLTDLRTRTISLGAPSTAAAAPAPTTSSAAVFPNESLARRGRYVIERSHARGGLGVLSLAHDVDLDRHVAVKEIRPELRDEPASRGRFVREAQITGQLEHPSILPVYALGRDEHGNPYYAMRFVGGRTLAHAIADYHRAPTNETLRDLLRRFGDVCRAIAYAHSRGIVHRDLKPANVMLGDFGETWIVDWGIAKRLTDADDPALPLQWQGKRQGDSSPDHTLPNQPLGTPRYMSPEQARDASRVGAPSDLYSLGAILFELVTGHPPRTPGDAHASTPRRLRPLLSICRKALAPQPQDRYATATDLAADVERWLADEPVHAHPEPPLQRLARWSRRHRGVALTAAALPVTIAAVLAIALVAVRHQRDLTANALHDRQLALDDSKHNERIARERLATGLVLSANGLLAEGRFRPAAAQYSEARRMLRSLGLSNTAALAGLLDTDIRSPRPLAAVRFELPHDKLPWFPRRNVSVARDGRTALVAHAGGSAALVDLITTATLRTFTGHAGVVRTVLLSDDAKTAYTGGDDGVLKIWDAVTGRELFSGHGHDNAIRYIAPASVAHLLLTAGDDHKLVLWDLDARKVLRTFTSHNPPNMHCEGVSVSPDGRTAMSGLQTGEVLLWDLTTGKEIRRLQGSTSCSAESILSHDGKTVFTGSNNDVSLWSWDAATGKQLYVKVNDGMTGSIDLSPAGDRLLLAGNDGVLRVTDAATGELLAARSDSRPVIDEVKAAADGHTAVTQNARGEIAVWDLRDRLDLTTFLGHDGPVLCAVGSADGLLVATAGNDGTVRVWDRATGRPLRQFGTPNRAPSGPNIANYWRVASVVAFNPDGRSVFTVAGFGQVAEWSLDTGNELHRFHGHAGFANGLSASAHGARVAFSGVDGATTVWEPATGRAFPLKGHKGLLDGCALSRDGHTALVYDTTGTVDVWDVDRTTTVRKLKADDSEVRSAAFSPDERRVITGCGDGMLRLWELASGKPVWSVPAHGVMTLSVAFSPDGHTIVTGGEDKVVRLWDAATGAELHAFTHHRGPVRAVSFTPDGSAILAASMDSTATLLDLTRPATYDDFAARLPQAYSRLATNPHDAAALATLGDWYAFRRADAIAADLRQQAVQSDATQPRLTLARCLWRLDRLDAAREQFRVARERNEAPAAYLDLCLSACIPQATAAK